MEFYGGLISQYAFPKETDVVRERLYDAVKYLDTLKKSIKFPNENFKLIKGKNGRPSTIAPQDDFYDKLNLTCKFTNTNKEEGVIEFSMDSFYDEYIALCIITGNYDGINMKKINYLENMMHMTKIFPEQYATAFLDEFRYINEYNDYTDYTKKTPANIRDIGIESKRRRERKQAQQDNRTYEEIYGDIKMRSVKYKKLSKYDVVDYDVENNCVFDYLNDKMGLRLTQERINDILKCNKNIKEGFTYLELLKIAQVYKFPICPRSVEGSIIDKSGLEIGKEDVRKKKKMLDFIIHDNHMNVIRKGDRKPIKKAKYIKSLDEIKGEYKKFITSDFDLFNEAKKLNTDKINIDYTTTRIYVGVGNILFYDVNAENDVEMVGDKRYLSVYHYINSSFNLKGTLNHECNEYFKLVNHIRNTTKYPDETNTEQFDHNGSYASHLYKNYEFPIPSINDHWEKYDKNEHSEIVCYYFYYIEVEETDDILCVFKRGTYCGYVLLQLEDKGINFKIKRVFKVSRSVCVKADEKIYNKYLMRRYIGWLAKTESVDYSRYDNIKDDEKTALKIKYGDDFKIVGDTSTIYKYNVRVSTGRLVYLVIKDLTNIKLFLFNRLIMEKNKKCRLNTVATDSLGYICNKKIITPKLGTLTGMFKDESRKIEKATSIDNDFVHRVSTFNFKDPKPKIYEDVDMDVREPTKEVFEELITNREPFMITGGPGYGKSYNINNVIIPYIKKKNMTYILCGSTIESSEHTINSHFKGLTQRQIIKKFDDIDYIIVDEAGQLTQDMLKHLEFVALMTKCKIILVGDEFQCPSVDSMGVSFLIGYFCKKLVNYNHVILKWHAHARYTKELDAILQSIKLNFSNAVMLEEIVAKNFKFFDESNTLLNMAYTHKKCGENMIDGTKNSKSKQLFKNAIKGQGEKVCFTVHWMQGKTIDVDYSMHEVNKMYRLPYILYTAISRARSVEQIKMINIKAKKKIEGNKMTDEEKKKQHDAYNQKKQEYETLTAEEKQQQFINELNTSLSEYVNFDGEINKIIKCMGCFGCLASSLRSVENNRRDDRQNMNKQGYKQKYSHKTMLETFNKYASWDMSNRSKRHTCEGKRPQFVLNGNNKLDIIMDD